MNNELIIDNFAGGGGASTGIEMALNRPVDAAINHNALAIALHAANHPQTRHFCEDIFNVDVDEVAAGRPVGLAWFSPDCKHFSKAKGGKPRSKKIRGLAWVVTSKWANQAKSRPRVIMLENVEEFQDWGPLLKDGSPCPDGKGRTFKKFVKRLIGLGYAVEWRELRACDYGAPTIRKRLYLIARCDGRPIVWPKPTHGSPESIEVKSRQLQPWKTAARDCIDWSLPCHSIFLTKEEGRKVRVNRPLAAATMRRLARGIFKFVLNAEKPFIVAMPQGDGVPFITEHANSSNQRNMPVDEPLRTLCAETKGGSFAPVMPMLMKYHGGNQSEARNHSTDAPLMTLDTSNRFGLVASFLAKHYGGVVGSDVEKPIGTITAVDHHSLVTGFMQQSGHYSSNSGMTKSVDEPMRTQTAQAEHALVASHLTKFYSSNIGQETDAPIHSITANGNHIGEVRAFLMKYYGSGGQDQSISEPMHTIPTVDRFGLVTVEGQDYAISDICMRMLAPRELYRGQGFPEDYRIQIEVDVIRNGKPKRVNLSNEAQVRMCGNSVCPPVAAALVAANVPELRKL